MDRKTVVYRGSLKSCNYRCSYCPFSKHRALKGETEKDREALLRFCNSIKERAESENIGAVFITSYGEAAIYEYYWDAMAGLSQTSSVEYVGIQTNLSFDVFHVTGRFEKSGGLKEKLRLWATFHPEMTAAEDFAEKCRILTGMGVSVCAGAVGVPENIRLIKNLRVLLPPEVYLWINKMDGLGRSYTREEINAFLSADPFFENELKLHAADPDMCAGRCFVESDGKVHTCNISRTKPANWYDSSPEEIWSPLCTRKICSCYLAYGGRTDFENLFGIYPVFRHPFRAKAVFCDIDGTIIRTGQKGLSERNRAVLQAVSQMCPVFFVTSLPYEKAVSVLKNDTDIFSGGACASGGYIFIKENGDITEKVFPAEGISYSVIRRISEEKHAEVKIFRYKKEIYKVTLYRKRGDDWSTEETEQISDMISGKVRVFAEKNCLQIVSTKAGKGNAVREICMHTGISPEYTVALGNDTEDLAMKEVCGFYKEIKL